MKGSKKRYRLGHGVLFMMSGIIGEFTSIITLEKRMRATCTDLESVGKIWNPLTSVCVSAKTLIKSN